MAETHTIQIQGENFTFAPPYAEGHVLNGAEANQLNQVYGENMRNNFAKKVKEAKEAGSFDLATFQAQFDKYADKYEFGARVGGGGGGRRDPVKSEAIAIASDKVRDALKKGGKNLKDYSAKQVREAAEKLLARDSSIMELARQRVAENQAVATESLDDIVAGLVPEAPAAEAPATVEAA
jgi:hypothetical protein